VVTAVIVVAILALASAVVAGLVVRRRTPAPEPNRELVEVVSEMRQKMDALSQDLSSALERAERAIELSPVRASAREVRARARVRLGDLPGAYADLVEAARLYPEKPWYAEQRDRLRADLPRRVPGQP